MFDYEDKAQYDFEDLKRIIDILRGEGGCPWDREQTHASLKSSTLEEAYELIDAIDNSDMANLREELGDVLLHVVFHSKIASDDKTFTLDEVIDELVRKMIRRHPHVFSHHKADTSTEVLVKWEEIKQVEKQYESQTHKLQSVPKAMPALLRAYKVQKKAAKTGFDFPNWQQAFEKVREEMAEFEAEASAGDVRALQEEYGDLLFAITNVSRFFEINPEISLTNAIEKFINRFKGIEEMAVNQGFQLSDLSLEALDKLWKAAKENGHQPVDGCDSE